MKYQHPFCLGCEQEMLIPLLIIFNKSYDEGKIPEMWICKCDSGIQKRFENSSTKSLTSFTDMRYMQNNGNFFEVSLDDRVITKEMAYR